MMSPEERIEYRLEQSERRHQNELANIRFQTADTADRTNFDSLCARSPIAARFKDQVEKQLAAERQRGSNFPRETVLAYLIGQRAIKQAPRAKGRQERQAQDQRTRQQVRPGSGRSDTGSGGSRLSERSARAKRLENMDL